MYLYLAFAANAIEITGQGNLGYILSQCRSLDKHKDCHIRSAIASARQFS